MCLQFRMEFLCSEDEEGKENWVKVHVPKWMQEAIDDRDYKKLQESCFDVKAHICKYAYFSLFMQFYKHLMVHSGNPWSVLHITFFDCSPQFFVMKYFTKGVPIIRLGWLR